MFGSSNSRIVDTTAYFTRLTDAFIYSSIVVL